MPDCCIMLSDLQTLACVETVGTFWFTALLFKWLNTLARARLLFQFKSVGDEWRDTLCTPVTLLRDLFIFQCCGFYLKFKKILFFCLKKKMPWWTISAPLTSHSSRVAASRNLYLSFSSNLWLFWAFFSMLVIFGSCLGFFQYPSLHLHLKKKKSFLYILTFFSLGRRQKGGTAHGKVIAFRPVNPKWENQMLPRSGGAIPGVEKGRE